MYSAASAPEGIEMGQFGWLLLLEALAYPLAEVVSRPVSELVPYSVASPAYWAGSFLPSVSFHLGSLSSLAVAKRARWFVVSPVGSVFAEEDFRFAEVRLELCLPVFSSA